MIEASRRLLVGIEGPELSGREHRALGASPPYGVLLLPRNLVSAAQAAALVTRIRSLADPAPLLFVDQEGGPVDRLGPLLGRSFPSATTTAGKGTDRVHENAYLMGRAARLLGFDVDLAPVVDLAQPQTGAVVLAGRTYGFHVEDVTVAALVFLHGLKRAGVSSCLKHFPGIGRGPVDSHVALPVVDAHDVDLMVTDVAPFTRLARSADGILVGHGAYPGFTGDLTPASQSPRMIGILRGPVAFDGVVFSDDLGMGALDGSLVERAAASAAAGCDVLCVSKLGSDVEAYPELVARLAEEGGDGLAREARLAELQRRCAEAPRPPFEAAGWERLGEDVDTFLTDLERPRERKPAEDE